MCGVYGIRHVASGRIYVGSSKDINKRWAVHVRGLEHGTHCSRYLQHAWSKHGSDAFEFVVLETCLPGERIVREQAYIDQLRAADQQYGFNLSETARMSTPSADGRERIAASKRGKARSAETIAKMSAATKRQFASPEAREQQAARIRGNKHTAEARAKISEASRRRFENPISDETREKLSANARGNKNFLGRHHSPETRMRMSLAQLGRSVSDETLRKMSDATRRQMAAPEARAHLSKINSGKTHSVNTREKMSVTHRGLKHSAETRARMSAAQLLRWSSQHKSDRKEAIQ